MKHTGQNFTGVGYTVFRCSHEFAASLVRREHYAKSTSKLSVYAFALVDPWLRLVGASMWLPPTKAAATALAGEHHAKVLSLSRFAVCDDLGRNAASWFLSRCIARIKHDGRFRHLLTFADTYRGHEGVIYKATNWKYLGVTKPTEVWLNAEGQMVTRKRGPVNLTTNEMRLAGNRLVGRYPKHRYGLAL